MIVEAGDKTTLAKGLQGFQVSAARHINAALAGRRGAVFPDRYHTVMITTPRQMRHTLAYVLGNWRKHREDQNPQLRGWRLDWFSSTPMFGGWRERFTGSEPIGYQQLRVSAAQTWLLREGWRRCSPTISMAEAPSSRREEA